MRIAVLSLVVVFGVAFAVEAPTRASQIPQAPADPECAPHGSLRVRTTLYFGLNRRSGTVSARDWRGFLANEVTPRFPQGFTVWEANGQWRLASGRIERERSKVLLVVHDSSLEASTRVAELVDRYKRAFDQESVLWETVLVCATF